MSARRHAVLWGIVSAVLALAAPAWALEDPLITDKSGDAVPLALNYCEVLGCPVSTPPISEPAIDILAADIERRGSNLVFTVEVLDLDHQPTAFPLPDDVQGFAMSFSYGDVSLNVDASKDYTGETTGARVFGNRPNELDPVSRPVDVVFDNAGNTVTFTVPLRVLDEVVAELCGTCPAVSNGTTFDHVYAVTWVLVTLPTGDGTGPSYWDFAFAPTSYTVGA